MLLSNLIDTTILLAKQELSFCGHREAEGSENRGNFIEVFNSKIKYNEELRNHIKKLGKSFCSKTIQNDLIFCISEVIKEEINQQLKDTEFFAVIVDDTTDITEKSQCAVSLRYVEKKSLNIYERFLGFYDVSDDRTSEALYTLVASVLSPFNYREKLVAQCYDGASVMAGHINGLQMKIKNDAPEATFIHCSAHKLNLVLQDGCKSIKECPIFFATLSGIPNFFHQSAKRTVVADNLIGKRIPSFCETRWASRSKIVLLLTNEYLNFISVFENIMNDRSSGMVSINSAKGFLKSFLEFEFVFLLNVFSEIFLKTDFLYDILQKKTFDVVLCKKYVDTCITQLGELRTDDISYNLKTKSANLVNNAKQTISFSSTELKNVPPSNIINYDETNLTDDPGRK
ncbi:zinc finger MYM-type protein 1-like [Anthonomus grandis grandis]|uniref:zinc finger MYM-type protein 1-like n=1 Tax=Anthonomus grandis grandis TaxID=2921223 RepID=UPI0021666038|nr:zinc finger MYM-type protein 1-like [Anthonomus grandis grandis]